MSLDAGTPLIAEARAEPNALVVRLTGDLTIVNAPELRVALTKLVDEHKPEKLVLNFDQIKYIDSGALGVLIETRKVTSKHGGQVVLTHLTPEVRGLIGIMKLDTVFGIMDTVTDALA